MTILELERAAYIAGDTNTANLLARIDDLTRALGRAVAELEDFTYDEQLIADLREVLG